jgi:predicted ATPase
MNKSELKISIKEIGPIKNTVFNINIKDLTGILGLPNSGKSYALRSIYWFLQLLDENRYSEIQNMFTKNILYNEIITQPENNKNIKNEIINQVQRYIDNIKSGKNSSYSGGTIYDRTLQLNFKLNVVMLSTLLKNVFKKTMDDYVNTNKLGSITVNGKTMMQIIKETNFDISKGKNNIILNGKFESLYLPDRTGDSKEYYEMSRILRRNPISIIINDINVNFSENDILVNFNLTLTPSKEPSRYDVLDNNLNSGDFISIISSRLKKYIIDFYLNSIKSSISDISGLNSIKFIPYGRNIIVQLFNNAIKMSISEPNDVLNMLYNLRNAPFSSYFSWLDKGRSSLDNIDDDIKLFFHFIMNGAIEIDGSSGGFKYKYSGDNFVDINLSSAMVEEITGLMLPIISSHEGDLLIIEEPEAQLHISTQIIMGILLMYVAKKMNIKILFSTHSDTLAFTIQHIMNNRINGESIKQLMSKVYNSKVPDIKFNMFNSESNNEFTFYYMEKEKKVKKVNNRDLERNVPGISSVVDDLVNWAFTSLQENKKGEED